MRQSGFRLSRFTLTGTLAWSLLAAVSLVVPHAVFATPVYLKLDSRFPSGHHPRKFLESKTKNVQFQRWLRVKTADGRFGWLPDEYVLTPLRLATEAVLTEDVPVRTENVMDAINHQSIKKETRALILEISGSWVRTQPFPASEHPVAWVPTQALKPARDAQTKKAFAFKEIGLYVMPGDYARPISHVAEGKILQVSKVQGKWLEVSHRGSFAFVRRADVWLIEDFDATGAAPLVPKAPLRSAPYPYADLITNLAPSMKLSVLEAKHLRWGQARLPQVGQVWWPIDDEQGPERETAELRTRLMTSELFSRKIFDMASSPAIPQLKFVSAKGVFRTTDGKEWLKIPQFKDENYPIAIAGEGPVFVGPYVSDDHGETFQTWIRWDNLVATLKNRYHITPRGLQLIEIRPEDPAGLKLSVRLNIGLEKPVKLTTIDQGVTWRALR